MASRRWFSFYRKREEAGEPVAVSYTKEEVGLMLQVYGSDVPTALHLLAEVYDADLEEASRLRGVAVGLKTTADGQYQRAINEAERQHLAGLGQAQDADNQATGHVVSALAVAAVLAKGGIEVEAVTVPPPQSYAKLDLRAVLESAFAEQPDSPDAAA